MCICFKGKALLGKLLPRLEKERYTPSRGKGQDHGAELQTLTASYKVFRKHTMINCKYKACAAKSFQLLKTFCLLSKRTLQICGFPLHFAYKDMDSIVESVKATGSFAYLTATIYLQSERPQLFCQKALEWSIDNFQSDKTFGHFHF